jgi:hypothetical protein
MLQDNFSTDVVLGGATPVVVLYEDGQLLVQDRQSSKGIVYWSKQLAGDELTQFKNQIAPIYRVPEIKSRYDITPNATSMPRTCFLFRDGKRSLVTQVRGLMLPDTELSSYTELSLGGAEEELPAELIDIHKYLASLDRGKEKEWQPQYVEVLLWPCAAKFTDGAVDWPAKWPALKSKRAIPVRCCLGKRDVFSIMLDGAMLPDVRNLLNDDVRAVNTADRSWMFACRHVFPSEPEWREPFNQVLVDHFQGKND